MGPDLVRRLRANGLTYRVEPDGRIALRSARGPVGGLISEDEIEPFLEDLTRRGNPMLAFLFVALGGK